MHNNGLSPPLLRCVVLTRETASAMLRQAARGHLAYQDLPAVEALLAPIADDASGVGADLRASGDEYLALKDLRNEARLAEREALKAEDEQDAPLQVAHREWASLVELGAQALAGSTKDLEIGCWVCEGLVRTEGFPGLAYGLELLAGLVEQYWDAGLYPAEEEEGVEDRIAPLAGLLGRDGQGVLVQPVKMLPVSDRSDLPLAALWTFELANAPIPSTQDPDTRERLVARQAEQLDSINIAIKTSSLAFLKEVHASALQALASLDRLMDALDSKTGVGRFGSQVSTPLQAIVELIEQKVGHLFTTESDASGSDGDAVVAAGGGSTGGGGGPVTSRNQALETVLHVADYFERHEPQSMIAHSLRDVVRRARMPLVDLLAELLPDDAQRSEFLQRAGIKSESASSDADAY